MMVDQIQVTEPTNLRYRTHPRRNMASLIYAELPSPLIAAFAARLHHHQAQQHPVDRKALLFLPRVGRMYHH